MSVPILFLLLPLALLLAGAAVYGFLWAVRTGQYEDVHTPALRLLTDDDMNATPERENGRPNRQPAGPPSKEGDGDHPVS